MLIFWNALRVKTQSARPAQSSKGDLILENGEFVVTEQGVMARFKPPLARLSGHYPWSMLPVGIAALRVLISGEDDHACHLIVSRFNLSIEETDELDRKINFYIGPDQVAHEGPSIVRSDVDQLMTWGAKLSSRCPVRSAADQLARLPKMTDRELGRFVSGLLR